jgi:dynein heavy chain
MINKTIDEISELWAQTYFTVVGYRDTKDRFIIRDVDDIITQLEDNQMTIQTSMGSKHVAEIRPKVEGWEKKLGYISDVIDEWLAF